MAGFDNDVMYADNVDFTGGSPVTGKVTTNGQLLIGASSAPNIKVGNLTSPLGTLLIGYSSPNITLDLAGGSMGVDSIAVQTGTSPVVPDSNGLVTFNGAVVAAGTNPVRSDGTGANTYALEVQISQAIAAADATKIGLSNFDSAAFDVSATGFVQLNGGGIASTSFDVQANTAPGTDPVVPTAAGVVTVNGAAVANHSVVLETRSRAANAYNLEIQYATSAAATDATKSGVAHFDSTDFSVDANGFVTLAGAGAGQTITGDSGGALAPTTGNWNIVGGPGVTTTGSGSTLTINSVVYTDQGGSTSVLSDSGSFATAGITLTLPAAPAQGEICEFTTTSAAVLVVDAPSTHLIRSGNAISSAGGTITSSGLAGDSLVLRYRAATTTWHAISVIGVWNTA